MATQLTSQTRFKALFAPALVASAALMLVGCGGSAATGGLPTSPHKATFELDGQTYRFAPVVCTTEDGLPKVSGPGTNVSDGSALFLDINIGEEDGWPLGEIHVYFGGFDAPTNDYVVAEIGTGNDYGMGDSMDGFDLEADFANADGKEMGTGSFVINCEE